jgi:hypothetical protein
MMEPLRLAATYFNCINKYVKFFTACPVSNKVDSHTVRNNPNEPHFSPLPQSVPHAI